MARAHRVDIRRDPRFNLSKHGRWVEVIHTGQEKIGRIAYFDNHTLLYNVAGMEDRQWWGGQYSPSQIRLLDYPAEPWFSFKKKAKEKGRSDLTAESPSIIIDPVVKVTTPSNPGGDVMARKRAAVEIEDEDEEFDDELEDLDDPVDDEDEAPRRKSKAGKKGPAKTKKDDKPKGIGARQIADRLGVDGKTFRAWLRRQVAAGEIDMNGRAEKERYDFGPDWSAPLVQRILKAWNEVSHEKGAGLKKAQAANAAKRAEKAKSGKSKPAAAKAPAKKAPAKKAAARKSR